MKLAVLGPGGLGCLLAALFREAGAEVSLVDYRPERVARLRLRGIQVHTLEGGHRVVQVPIGLAPEVGPCDLTIVAVKAYQTETAARALPGLMSRGGPGPHPAKRLGQPGGHSPDRGARAPAGGGGPPGGDSAG